MQYALPLGIYQDRKIDLDTIINHKIYISINKMLVKSA